MKIKYTTNPDTLSFERLKNILKTMGYTYCEKSSSAVSYMLEAYEVWSMNGGKTRFCISPIRLGFQTDRTILLTEGREKVLTFLKKGIDENKLPGS